MTEMTITRDGVEFIDGVGPVQRPRSGEVVRIVSQSVVRSLVVTGRAVEGVRLPLKVHQEVATSTTAGDLSEVEGSESGAEAETQGESWDAVPSISRPSMALLTKNAPDADPRTVTREQLLEWLDGSVRRTDLVVQALERWRESSGDEDG